MSDMDSYAPCPCGSGKKIKFCCHKIYPEMEKIERMQENQPRQALQHLDKLEQKHPANPWIVTTRAGTLMQEGEFREAKVTLLKFLKQNSEHPRANAFYALASMNEDGYPESKKAVHRALKRSITETPRIVASLLETIGSYHLADNEVAAARAHLVLALRLQNNETDARRIAMALTQIDFDLSTPLLIRGGQRTPQFEAPESVKEIVDKAYKLSHVGCWNEAADLMTQALEKEPNLGELHHLKGLFLLWDGVEKTAAESFHRAAELHDNSITALECEVLAQATERRHDAAGARILRRAYDVTSTSQLLTRLDDDARIIKQDVDPDQDPDDDDAPVGTYYFLDRSLPDTDTLKSLTLDSVPNYLGRIILYNESNVETDEFDGNAYLVGMEGSNLDQLIKAFEEAAGPCAKLSEGTTDDEDESDQEATPTVDELGRIPHDELPLHRNLFIPPKTPGHIRREIELSNWKHIFDVAWLETPLDTLGGKSPRDAAGDESLQTKLRAALILFDFFADSRGMIAPIAELEQTLGLSPQTLELDPNHGIEAVQSPIELYRIDPSQLTDDQLDQIEDRLRMLPHSRMMFGTLKEIASRDSFRERSPSQRDQLLRTLIDICGDSHRFEDALQWINQGLSLPGEGADPFQHSLSWKLREMRLRLTHDSNEGVLPLLKELWDHYGSKIPQLRPQLNHICQTLEIDPPWDSAIITPGSGGWEEGGESGPEKKLILPGQ